MEFKRINLEKYMENKMCPQCKVGYLKAREGKFGEFFGCSNYPNCKYTFTEKKGGYPQPSPRVPQAQPLNETPHNGNMVLLEEIQALGRRFDVQDKFLEELGKFLKNKLG